MNYSASILVTSILFFVFGHFQKGPRGRSGEPRAEQKVKTPQCYAPGFIWMNCIGSDNAEEVPGQRLTLVCQSARVFILQKYANGCPKLPAWDIEAFASDGLELGKPLAFALRPLAAAMPPRWSSGVGSCDGAGLCL